MAKRNKQKKSTANTANERYKLSPIEKELLGYCEDHQPVLLYGVDNVGRKDLILNVHKANGGLDQNQEYCKDSQEFEPGKSTERTWDYVNLALFDSSEIFAYLTNTYASNPLEYSPQDFDERKTPYDEGFFYCCKGLLFLDNLLCNDANTLVYHELTPHIKEGNTSYKWLVIYTEKLDGLSLYFREQFRLIPLDGERAVSVSAVEIAESKEQELMPIETTLFYNKTTGKFRFGSKESLPISPSSRHKVRIMAEKLMRCWKKGKPCPQSMIVRDTRKKTPRSIYDNRTKISNKLKDVRVNMPQSSNDEYLPPAEPKHFEIVS